MKTSKARLPAQKIIAVKSEKLLWLRNRLHLLLSPLHYSSLSGNSGGIHMFKDSSFVRRQNSGSARIARKQKTFICCFREVFYDSRELEFGESGCESTQRRAQKSSQISRLSSSIQINYFALDSLVKVAALVRIVMCSKTTDN